MSWSRVRGHDAVVEAFDRAWRRGRLAHAYLLAGPAGVGKRLFAEELARALLCEAPDRQRLEACDRCPSCLQARAGAHPDLFTAGRPDDGHELPIEVIRELCRGFALKSARGRGKVALLDDADDLNAAAANCFLKTLEEPPPRSVLLLVGTAPDRQLPTIVSRCQVVAFAPLPEALVAELLKGQGLEDARQVARLARLSGGSVGQALALADPALWDFRRALLAGLAAPRVEGVDLARRWTQFVEEAGKDSAAQRRRAALVLRLLLDLLRDALHLALDGEARLSEPEDRPALEALARRLGVEPLLAALERCLEADYHIDRRVQLVLVLEALTDALGQARG